MIKERDRTSQFNRRSALGAGLAAALAPSASGAALAARSDPAWLAPGISHELAIHRAATLSVERYDLSLDVTQRDVATGAVKIAVRQRAGAGDLIVDFRGPKLEGLRVNGRPIADPRRVNGHLVLPQRFLVSGLNLIEARFSTPIAPTDAAIIRFDDRSDGATYLYTLLVPSDANLLFPCFDQPDLKARFNWRIRAPASWEVLANGELKSRSPSN